ncbi:unnamed protein product [Phaedon cochleariae]|uniref:Peptidase S1 domain-containing protein n=1 Tax=Phaedon cochleariae TaxID=80249 RepID=A0A9N9SGB8_PHACE|nr:unnamed protein product [Phaedon cochleariae]
MFNHECTSRRGQVVGACMDGFLFGACCELPKDISVGEFIDEDIVSVGVIDNDILNNRPTIRPQTTPIDITSLGVSQITNSLLNPEILPTAEDNEVIQVSNDQYFTTTGVTHPETPDTIILNQHDNDIDPGYFHPTSRPNINDKTTMRTEQPNLPILGISISNAPIEYTTTSFSLPMFRPKPSSTGNDNYVRVPTVTHEPTKPNKNPDFNSIVNIMHLLNSTSVYGSSTMRPAEITKPPSTSYVFSTTLPPRRTQSTTRKKTTKKPKPTNRPTSTHRYPSPTKSTMANSPTAFITSSKPPSTSYIHSSSPTRRPPTTLNSHIVGPSFSVTNPSSTYPTPAPTIIVLGPISEETTERPRPTSYDKYPSTLTRPTALPQRKPVNHVTINNHITQNIYSTSERPSPTILITPKPSISTSVKPQDDDTVEVGATGPSPDDMINFPPVRNPNLNMSYIPNMNENDITTPIFIEDDALNANVESFVNKIIEGLQEPFQGLKDVVYNKKNMTVLSVGTTTIKPVKKQGTSSKKPQVVSSKPVVTSNIRTSTTSRPGNTSRKPATRRTTTTIPTRKQPTTTKRKVTKKPVTTTQSLIEHTTEAAAIDSEDYRTECGVRPLMRSAKIVGGKGATFGEFPWQVLVRESTWLGLFTKNKCGGVLISHKYVMTAAHCQPGFLASLVAVFGEFDISGDLEKKRPLSRNVKRVIVHRQYDAQTFENDLALLELEQPIHESFATVKTHKHGIEIPVCLPRDQEDFTGRMATVTGWGRLKYGGGVPSILQEVQVPIMENHVCQEMFRTAGHSKVILESFLCAGYANGQKDSCEGDSGGPLVLQRPDGRYQLAGTVSHGIKCAAPYLPGVYMRTQFFKPWITSITGVTAP